MSVSEELIKIKRIRPDTSTAMIVNFNHRPLSTEELKETSVELISKETNSSRPTVLINKKGVKYKGKIHKHNLSQTLLLVRKKNKNKGELIAFSTVNMMNVSSENKRNSIQANDNNISVKEKHEKFVEMFGSKRAKRRSHLRNNLELNMMENSVKMVETAIATEVNEEKFNDMEDISMEVIKDILPPADRTTNVISNIYNIKTIISDNEFDKLDEAADYVLENMPSKNDEDNMVQFLLPYFDMLSKNLNKEKIKILMFAVSLWNHFKLLDKKYVGRKLEKLATYICPYSTDVGKKILNEFSERVELTWIKTRSKNDKIVCYICVLIYLACGKLNSNLLESQLAGYKHQYLQRYLKLMGFVQDNSKNWNLKYPLPKIPLPTNKKRSK